MTVRIGSKGQVVIPKAIRDDAGLHPGDPVDFEFRDGEVVLMRSDREMRPLGGRYAGSGIDSAALLLEDRRREPR
ncbi:MAG: AbrB/MazE/SpoVT family DNA-binding domain-containing protein [Acidobacteriota bacterium]|nr:AbrB/MazE/SpoVT family DNA-binding domain-containing protein [Acidobacteriota bacterium]